MTHDLVNLAGSYISIGAIRSVLDEVENGEPTGNALVDTGGIYPIAFAGSAADIMQLIEQFCEQARGGHV